MEHLPSVRHALSEHFVRDLELRCPTPVQPPITAPPQYPSTPSPLATSIRVGLSLMGKLFSWQLLGECDKFLVSECKSYNICTPRSAKIAYIEIVHLQ